MHHTDQNSVLRTPGEELAQVETLIWLAELGIEFREQDVPEPENDQAIADSEV